VEGKSQQQEQASQTQENEGKDTGGVQVSEGTITVESFTLEGENIAIDVLIVVAE